MTTSEKQNLMYSLFGIMVSKGIMRDQQDMTSKLKGICKALTIAHGLTEKESEECLLYFFREYAKGCSVPITDTMIKSQFIPTVRNYPFMSKDDFLWGESMIIACQSK